MLRRIAVAALTAAAATVVAVSVLSEDETGPAVSTSSKAAARPARSDARSAPDPALRQHSERPGGGTKRAAPADGRIPTPGDLIISGVTGLTASPDLLRRIRAGRVAGVLLLGPNISTVPQVQKLTRSVRTAAAEGGQLPPLIMVDQEGGIVKRFRSAHPYASARDLRLLAPEEVERQGRLTGRDLVARGVNVDLAPVADVARRADNFLASRAFAGEPDRVARYACRFAAGLRRAGIATALKHFPGLGGAGSANTDDGPVTVTGSISLLRTDWEPYVRCGDAPRTLVMVSNAVYPAMTGSLPAVLAVRTYSALRSLGVQGPVVTDGLEASALDGLRDVAVRAVRAGADLLLYTSEARAQTAWAELSAAVSDGRVSRAVLRDRARRVSVLRRGVGGS